MKKYTLLVTLLLAFVHFSNGQQYKNILKLGTGGFIVPGVYNPKVNIPSRLMEQHGLFYERKLNQRLNLACGISWWNSYIGNGYYFGERQTITTLKNTGTDILTLTRTNYKMVDVALGYSLVKTKKQQVRAYLGLSFAKGNDHFTDYEILPPLPPGWYYYDASMWSYDHSDVHPGVVSSVSYDYTISKGRFSVGADVKYRKYFGIYSPGINFNDKQLFSLYSSQIDYGVHLGFNF